VHVEPWFGLPQVIQIASCCLFDSISAVFNHCELHHNLCKTNAKKNKKKNQSCFYFGRCYDSIFSDEMENDSAKHV